MRSLSVLFLLLIACQPNREPPGSDPNDRPQAEGRDRLRDQLGSLTGFPQLDSSLHVRQTIVADLFSDKLGLVVLTASNRQDSVSLNTVRLYRWVDDGYMQSDTIELPRAVRSQAYPVDAHSGSELVLHTSDSLRRNGLTILGIDRTAPRWRYLFRIDSLQPVFYRMSDNTMGLLQYDSLSDFSFGSIVFPKRLYRITGDVYARRAYDSTWIRLIRYTRDSIYQSFQLEREQIRKSGTGQDREKSARYLRALMAFVVFDPSWLHARTFLQTEKSFMAPYLVSTHIDAIQRLILSNRVAPFVEVSTTAEDESEVLLLAEFDETLERGNQTHAALILDRLAPLVTDLGLALRLVEVSTNPGNALALVLSARNLLQRFADRGVPSAVVVRRLGLLERRLGNEEAAQMLLRRSLLYDSTSAEAAEIRHSLP